MKKTMTIVGCDDYWKIVICAREYREVVTYNYIIIKTCWNDKVLRKGIAIQDILICEEKMSNILESSTVIMNRST